MSGLQIDWEVANRITLLNLKDYQRVLTEELEKFKNDQQWLHSEDVVRHQKVIAALDIVIAEYEN